MNETLWREYYRFVKLDDRRKKEMVERCGGVKVLNPQTPKARPETIDEAAVRIKKEIIATEPAVQPNTGVL